MEQEKNNIFYRPSIRPEQSYESVSAFPVIVPAKEEVAKESTADVFVQITNDFVDLYNSFKKIPEELQFILYSSNYPILEYLINYTIERIEAEKIEAAKTTEEETEEDIAQEYGITVSEYSDSEGAEAEMGTDDNEDVIGQSNFKTAIVQITSEHESDLALLKKNYLSSMYQVVSRYFIDITECANAISSLDETYLLQNIDGNAVFVKDSKQQYIKDEIIRSQIERASKLSLFSKTHSQENTLVYLRGLVAADALRKRYCNNTAPDTSATNGIAEREALAVSRNKQEQKYENALLNYYKYLNSLSIITSDILDMTVNEARLKAFLVKDGVDIFKTVDKQATDSEGNTSSQLSSVSSSSSSSSSGNSNILSNINIDTKSFSDAAGKVINKVVDTNSVNKSINKVGDFISNTVDKTLNSGSFERV